MSDRDPGRAAQVVTANRLGDGAVVYLCGDDTWTTDIRRSGRAADAAVAAALLAQGQKAVEAAVVVGPYLIAVHVGADGVRPASLRERIRAEGPSQPVADAIALAYP